MLHRLNRENMATAIFQDDTLRITTKSGATVHALNASEIKAVSLTKLPVANCLTVLTKQEDLQEAAREAKGKPKTHQ